MWNTVPFRTLVDILVLCVSMPGGSVQLRRERKVGRLDIIPEDKGGFTLWLNELEIGGYGTSLAEARADLLSAVRAYVADYIHQLDVYRHLPDLARLEPLVLRLALARDDSELLDALFDA
jgi:Antitoxin of toxin-antitoxin, RelE / RelB, TA system